MKSIRNKLFVQIGLLITLLMALLIILNSFFLAPFYMYQQKNRMIESFELVNALSEEQLKGDGEDLYQIEGNQDLDLLLTDQDEKVVYASAAYNNDKRITGQKRPAPNTGVLPPEIVKLSTTPVNDQLTFIQVIDPFFKIESLLLEGVLDGGMTIELRIPIQSIQTSIDLTNQILIYFGMTFFVLSMVFAYVLSNTFTKPILSMNAAAKKMQALDFTSICKVTSKDELGELAENINQMSATLSSTIHALHEKDEKRRTLLNNVSHELKTPLTLMQGYGVALQKNVVKNPEKTAFYCDVIIDETQKMSQLVEALLDIDQIELDQTMMQKRHFEINGFVAEVFKKFEHVMDSKGIQHECHLIEATEILCDPLMTERVLKNYLSNAINYVNGGKELSLKLMARDQVVRVEVYNTCDPLGREDMEKIWESFYKLDPSRSRALGGHGLGLSIVKAIQTSHNQGFGVYNQGDGVCFWFEVACYQ